MAAQQLARKVGQARSGSDNAQKTSERRFTKGQSVSRFGLAARRQAGKQRDLGSNLLRLSFLFKSCGLWTLVL